MDFADVPNEDEEEVDTRANLTPKKIADGYAECDVRLVAGQKKGSKKGSKKGE